APTSGSTSSVARRRASSAACTAARPTTMPRRWRRWWNVRCPVGERNFGARWWRESLGIARWATRPAMGTMGLFGALSLAGCATRWAEPRLEETQLADARDDIAVNVNALALQRNEGWDVGHAGVALAFPDSTDIDAAGTQNWREAMANLAVMMTPVAPALQ